jgi:hypothetical protein
MAVVEEIKRDGFADAKWVERWDVAFADLYLEARDRSAATPDTAAFARPGMPAVAR